MKKLLLLVAVLAMLLPSCKKIEESIDALENRIEVLENETIPTIDEQIAAIQTSIKALKEVDESLDESIKALEANDEATAEEIAALQDADAAIEAKIEELKKYVDDSINSTKDWVSATFATLEQLNALSSEVVTLKNLVDANKAEAAANLANAISNLETSLKKWVGEQLSNYYTIAEIDAKIANLEKAIADGDAALQQQLNDLKTQLESAKKELTEAYKKAIEEAITENNGVINAKIASEIAAVNKRIDEEVAAINAKIAALQVQVDKNSSDIAKLLARIQSVSYVPQYSDGKALVTRIGAVSEVILDFKVSPKECVAELEKVWSEALSCEAVYTKTRAVSLVKMPVTEFVADAENGVITVTASGENLSEEFFAGTQEASVALVISDGNNSVTSEYVPMVTKEITDEIWYTTTDNQPLTPNHEGVDIFGANIVSNSYNEECGWFVLKFDAPVTKIGEKAFGAGSENDPKSTLQSIILPNGVQSIDFHAFSYCCDELLSVYMPDTVTEIGRTAFAGNGKLEYVRMSKNLTTMGLYAFSRCGSLKSIEIPETLTVIPDYAFRECSSLTSIAIHDKITTIGTYAFQNCTGLERVDITDLSAWCRIDFANYQSTPVEASRCLYLNGVKITDLVIPADVTEIKQYAFYNNDAITNVVLHNGITSIGHESFAACGSFGSPTSITIPESVSSIAASAFHMTNSLSAFYGKFATEDNRAIVINNELIAVAPAGLTSYRVPDGVTHIGETLFRKISLKTITIPSSVTSIGGRAFAALDNDDIVIFEGATPPTLESSAFKDIKGAIFVPAEAVDTYKSVWASLADYIKPYEEGMNIITYTSTDGNIVTPYSGERNEFRTIESLFNAKIISNTYENGEGKIVFDGVVSIIGAYAFYNCQTLKSIILPNGVVYLGGDAFHECRNLADVTLSNGLKTIYGGAFHFCDALKSLTIPDSVNDIREQAFFNCGLDYIYSKNSTADNMSLIEDNNLHWVAKSYPAGDYIIPDGVVKIANYAFGYPTNVISITLPESIETFSDHPFIGVNKISAFYGKYTTEDHRAVIKDNKLYGVATYGITEYTVPEGVKEIAYRMLRVCGLTTIHLPASLEKVGGNQFEDATKLKYVYCKAVVPPTSDGQLFLDANNVEKIYVPHNSVEAYKAAEGWKTKADKIVGYDF